MRRGNIKNMVEKSLLLMMIKSKGYCTVKGTKAWRRCHVCAFQNERHTFCTSDADYKYRRSLSFYITKYGRDEDLLKVLL